MRSAFAIVALLLATGDARAAQPPENSGPASWHLDVSASVLAESWDLNESHEWLAGGVAGLDRRVWRVWWLRAEALALRVAQPEGAWVRGFTIGTRVRLQRARVRPLVDVGVGLSNATAPVPPRGTRVNYLAVIGVGADVRVSSRLALVVTGRWLHVSNNGREGRARNPDVQSLGATVGVGWEY